MKRERIGTIMQSALSVLSAGGLIIAAATVPNAAGILLPLIRTHHKKTDRRSLERALLKLKQKRLVQFVSRGGTSMLQITEMGKQRFISLDPTSFKIALPKKWDGAWTIILYDIPEKMKAARDALGRTLRQIGCYPYHKSVYVHPTDCRDEVDYIVELFGIGNFVLHFRTNSLGKHEYRARRYFQLA